MRKLFQKILLKRKRRKAKSFPAPKVIIFDFDGTLADTCEFIIEIFNSFAPEFKFRQVDMAKLPSFKHKTARQMIRHLRISAIKIPKILSKAKKEYQQRLSHILIFEGIKESLLEMKKQGIVLGIVSSNSKENINLILRNNDLEIFDFVYSTVNVLGKNRALKNLITEKGFKKDEVIYVGDEIRDVMTAKKLGVRVASVTWGYNSPSSLKKYRPNFLLNHPDELTQLIEAN